MRKLRALWMRLRGQFEGRRVDDEFSAELESHLQMHIEDNLRAGMPPERARREALIKLGGLEQTRQAYRERTGLPWLDRLGQDIHFGLRQLRKSPGFSLTAILTLALGIGANTALFSVVNGVLLNPLPYPHPEQLVTLHMSKPNFATGAISFPNFRDWQAQNRTFGAMALSRNNSINLIANGEAENLLMNYITADFFSLLGVEPVMGRNFAPGEDDLGGPALVEISEGLWKRKFGGGLDILGKPLNLDGKSYTIIGVLPARFDLRVSNFFPTDIYLPLGQFANPALNNRRAALGLHGVGRLKPGVTLEQARADMDAVSRNLANAYPDSNRDTKANLFPLDRSMTTAIRPALLLLLGAVGFVLLIAGVNVASLLFARLQARKHEFGIRAALGAGRTRLLRQLLTESVLLALVGGSLGVLLAAFGTHTALRVLPTELPRMQSVHVDLHVLAFSFAISTLAGVAFGLAPALRLALRQPSSVLLGAGRRITRHAHRTQRTLLAIEIATALVLLIGAGLMVRSLTELWRVDPGFETHHLLTFRVSLSPHMTNAPPAAVRAAWRELRDTASATPGVESVSMTQAASPMRTEDDMTFWPADQPEPRSDSEKNWTLVYGVQPDYLRVMKIPLLRGRFFSPQDNEKSPPVVVVDEIFAAFFFPRQDALGKRIRWGDGPREQAEIVGVVGHVKQWGLDNDDAMSLRSQLYMDADQAPDDQVGVAAGVMARTSGRPQAVVSPLKRRIQQLNSENVMCSALTMDEVIAETLSTRRFSMLLLVAFAVLALLLAAVGIYGVISYLIGQRTQEFGIRVALGAQPRDVLAIVMNEGGRIALYGIALGVLAALGLTRLMGKLLFGVKPTDPLTFAAVALLLTAVALAACLLPAWCATRVDPMQALRTQ